MEAKVSHCVKEGVSVVNLLAAILINFGKYLWGEVLGGSDLKAAPTGFSGPKIAAVTTPLSDCSQL